MQAEAVKQAPRAGHTTCCCISICMHTGQAGAAVYMIMTVRFSSILLYHLQACVPALGGAPPVMLEHHITSNTGITCCWLSLCSFSCLM